MHLKAHLALWLSIKWRKITKISRHILSTCSLSALAISFKILNNQKRPGLRPGPHWGAYSAPQTPSWRGRGTPLPHLPPSAQAPRSSRCGARSGLRPPLSTTRLVSPPNKNPAYGPDPLSTMRRHLRFTFWLEITLSGNLWYNLCADLKLISIPNSVS